MRVYVRHGKIHYFSHFVDMSKCYIALDIKYTLMGTGLILDIRNPKVVHKTCYYFMMINL